MTKDKVLTPMQRQYQEIKKQHQEALLFFRLGDFYEMFYEDAITVSKEVGLTLTSRHKKSDNEMKMCGVPYHSADKYLAQLTRKGYKIAICEQVSNPDLPGIVKREVVRIITPGTTFQEEVLDAKTNNFVLALVEKNNQFGICLTDITTGELEVNELSNLGLLKTFLFRIQPAEIIFDKETFSSSEIENFILDNLKATISYRKPPKNSTDILKKQFQNINSLGLENTPLLIVASAVIIEYLKETQKTDLKHLVKIRHLNLHKTMPLDSNTIRHLELMVTIYEGDTKRSLLSILDKTKTASGGRLLRKVLLNPLLDEQTINNRLKAVQTIFLDSTFRLNLSDLKKTADIERGIAKLSCNRGNARDLYALKETLLLIPPLINIFPKDVGHELERLKQSLSLNDLNNLITVIDQAISEEAPLLISEGKMINDGYSSLLDDLRKIKQGGKEWLDNYQTKEKKRTGLSSLKIGYNKVFGFFIEISKMQSKSAPPEYTRKQTLTNAERYITPVLKEYEEKVLSADEQIIKLEHDLFQKIREQVISKVPQIQKIARALAYLDLYCSFAETAHSHNYVCPKITNDYDFDILDGRHPVVEQFLDNEQSFVPNDLIFRIQDQQIILLTGPNMSGKSTYLRQTALISLMAQIGSFVPAKAATLPIVDRIFTRVGASDNLSKGQSTFMVEMQETAFILNNATTKSLIIMDEIGRGTSTYDGLSLAWAIMEYIHSEIGAKTLFATHYHELLELSQKLTRATDLSIAVTENNEEVVFLHKVIPGGIDKSYGIEVAKLAGLPTKLIKNAKNVLSKHENNPIIRKNKDQLSFFNPQVVEKINISAIEKELGECDPNNMTPLQALEKLVELKNKI